MKKLTKLFRRKKKQTRYLDKNKALETLIDVKVILNDLGIQFWLTDGTLLGCWRENRFIDHDTDLDLGILISDYSDSILDAFRSNNFELVRTLGKLEMGYELTFKKADTYIDLFFFYEENKYYWHAAWRSTPEGRNLIKYYYEKFDLTTTSFMDNEFFIPSNTEKYLVTKYGENWKTPVQKWDWAFDPKNAVKTDIYLTETK